MKSGNQSIGLDGRVAQHEVNEPRALVESVAQSVQEEGVAQMRFSNQELEDVKLPNCAKPCRTILSRAALCYAKPSRAEPCRAGPCCSVPCRGDAVLYYVRPVPCRAMLHCAKPCRAEPCSTISSRAVPCRNQELEDVKCRWRDAGSACYRSLMRRGSTCGETRRAGMCFVLPSYARSRFEAKRVELAGYEGVSSFLACRGNMTSSAATQRRTDIAPATTPRRRVRVGRFDSDSFW